MAKYLSIFTVFIYLNLFSQTDRNGNPVFNSITISEEKEKDYQLKTNYYTIENNINNKNSSVFVNENPTLNEVEAFATKLPSDFFLILKDNSTINLVMIVDKPEKVFFVINPSTGTSETFPCNINGDITENRANEIIKQHYDKDAKLNGNVLSFNNKKFNVISSKEIKNKIKNLIAEKKLSEGSTGQVKFADKGVLKKIIIEESKKGGKLDFFTPIKDHEMDGIQIKPGVFSTNIGIALYKWGRENYELGVNTVEDALNIWSEIKNRKPNQREIEYIKMGFNKELEK
ncbi:hypothetical protein [Chryseobacterium chendengshani]|uniref:hypothetical protein n=1 Tax=Chryseobacterium sp. LJ756 TaxID=2864113 RepID=UPI001C63C77F|nr:hypothetical protein [Chryseobacterium sp. LJ756]MBW7676427.1 hypothetical protein [Chryseobacterium sp. LJ756]